MIMVMKEVCTRCWIMDHRRRDVDAQKRRRRKRNEEDSGGKEKGEEEKEVKAERHEEKGNKPAVHVHSIGT